MRKEITDPTIRTHKTGGWLNCSCVRVLRTLHN